MSREGEEGGGVGGRWPVVVAGSVYVSRCEGVV